MNGRKQIDDLSQTCHGLLNEVLQLSLDNDKTSNQIEHCVEASPLEIGDQPPLGADMEANEEAHPCLTVSDDPPQLPSTDNEKQC